MKPGLEQNMSTLVRCWKCGEPLIKLGKNEGLIKSQLIFFKSEQLIARCKRCKEHNVLPLFLDKSQAMIREPKLTIPLEKNIFGSGRVNDEDEIYNRISKEFNKGQKFRRNGSPDNKQ